MHSQAHNEAEELLKIILKPISVERREIAFRSKIVEIEAQFKDHTKGRTDSVDPPEYFEILKSFFGQASLKNMSLLDILLICFPSFPRLNKQGRFPLEKFETACRGENVKIIRSLLEELEISTAK